MNNGLSCDIHSKCSHLLKFVALLLLYQLEQFSGLAVCMLVVCGVIKVSVMVSGWVHENMNVANVHVVDERR